MIDRAWRWFVEAAMLSAPWLAIGMLGTLLAYGVGLSPLVVVVFMLLILFALIVVATWVDEEEVRLVPRLYRRSRRRPVIPPAKLPAKPAPPKKPARAVPLHAAQLPLFSDLGATRPADSWYDPRLDAPTVVRPTLQDWWDEPTEWDG